MAKKRYSRTASIKNLASYLGISYQDQNDSLVKLLNDFKLFSVGYNKKIYNQLHFVHDDFDLFLFDYSYVVSSGNATMKFKQTVLFINSKELGLPQFRMRPEGIWLRFGQWLNLKRDIDFDDYPEYSKQYFLTGPYEDFIRYTFKKEGILEFFTKEKNWSMEGMNYFFIFYKDKKIIRVDHLKKFIAKGIQLFEWIRDEEEEE